MNPGGPNGEPVSPAWSELLRRRTLFGALVMAMAVLAFLVPLWPELAPERRLGSLLAVAALLEGFHGFRRSDPAGRRSAWFGACMTLAIALALLNAPILTGRAVVALVAGWFFLDGARHAIAAVRDRRRGWDTKESWLPCIGNLAIVALVLNSGDRGRLWTLALAVSARLLAVAAQVARAPVYADQDAGDDAVRGLGFWENSELRALGDRIEAEEANRRWIDSYWTGTVVLTLFAIHLGRMGLDQSTLGIVSPAMAVVGDMVVALVIGLVGVVPARVLFRFATRPLEKQAWAWCLAAEAVSPTHWRLVLARRCVRFWLVDRLRFAVRLRQARFSLRRALAQGLQIGLPGSAILAATMPVWGMSWYFDTENYAAGIWNAWAEARTDTWREAMVRSVTDHEIRSGRPHPTFLVNPPGVTTHDDFAFLVIGDTGEGDASQHALRDSFLRASWQPDIRFVVVSSDVVYPAGAVRDYEAKFWLPFKGVRVPIYAIPGNHDWFDALEGFAATFLEPEAARVAMRARARLEPDLDTRASRRIERALREASRLREAYRVPTGFQQGPFFQIQTADFALIAVDTGIRKRVDPAQLAWLEETLESARGKFKMAILGHPLFAVGEYRASDNEDFRSIHELLRAHDVTLVMAGDTHDFEYYREIPGNPAETASPVMHHFVNGGGGAFLTMGVQLAPKQSFPTRDWAYYPSTAPLVEKVESRTAPWKKPLWWWTKECRAWPSAPEWLSAAFDDNVAPFFQSFVEVRVEPSRARVRVRPWGVHGRLRWADLERSQGLVPEHVDLASEVEWDFPMRP